MTDVLRWFTGGADYAYSNLLLCMHGDAVWARHLVASKLAIVASYLLVAHYLYRRWRAIRRTAFGRTFLYGSAVFVVCASVHLLVAAEYVWPVRRLEALLGYFVAGINILFVINLYRITALESVLRINVRRPHNAEDDHATGE